MAVTHDYPCGRVTGAYTTRGGQIAWTVAWDGVWANMPATFRSDHELAEGARVLLVDGLLVPERNGKSS